MTRAAAAAFPGVCIGIHCHNDCGLAVAGSMEAVRARAHSHVQGTLLGFGERCGNADLSTLIPNLQLKQGYSCIPGNCMPSLTATARKVADIANFSLPGNLPYVGGSAFAHKGGMHIDGVTKIPASFEHVSPESVGNRRRIPHERDFRESPRCWHADSEDTTPASPRILPKPRRFWSS